MRSASTIDLLKGKHWLKLASPLIVQVESETFRLPFLNEKSLTWAVKKKKINVENRREFIR